MLTEAMRIQALVCLAFAVILHALSYPAVAGTDLTVPGDSSLTLSQYAELGVPDPRNPWTSNEFVHALRVLDEIHRSQLPRASGPSRLLFDRLLLSYRREFELPYGQGLGEEAASESLPKNLLTLYSTSERDSLLFDEELIAIRAETLARTMETLPTRRSLLSQAEGLANMMTRTDSEAERVRMSEGMRRAEEMAKQVSDMVRDQTSDLIVIASIPEVGDRARELLLRKLQEYSPKLPAFLEDRDLEWVTNFLKTAAGSEVNAVIRSGLLDLARELESMREIS